MIAISNSIKNSELQSITEQNYSISREYYKAKKKIFIKFYSEKLKLDIANLEKYISIAVDTYISQVSDKIYESISLAQEMNATVATAASLEDYYYDVEIGNIITKLTKGDKNVASLLGIEFETFIVKALTDPQFIAVANSSANKYAQEVIDSLLSNVTHTGNIQAKSAVTTNKANIRPDIGINFSEKQKNGIGVELEQFLDLSDLQNELNLASMTEDILFDSLNSKMNGSLDTMNAYGFSLKIWKMQNSNGKKFMESAVLQKMLNNKFAESKNFTWSSEYAMSYAMYFLSSYLLNIINPLNVGFITASGLTWMDDFLENRRFYMDLVSVSPHDPVGSKRPRGYEIFPTVASAEIRIKTLVDKGNGFNLSNTSTSRSKKTGRIGLINRKIKAKS